MKPCICASETMHICVVAEDLCGKMFMCILVLSGEGNS